MTHTSTHESAGRRLVRTLVVVDVAIVLLLGGGAAWAASQTASQTHPRVVSTQPLLPGEFVGIQPVRVLDTRVPIGVATKAPLGPGQTIDVTIAGVGGVPSNATAVAINITSEGATAPSFFTVYPTGSTKPGTSTANISPGLSLAASGSFDLGTGGKVSVFNALGSVNAIMDVTGYYVLAPPLFTTDAAIYAGGGTVTYTGNNWPAACTAIKVDVFGPGGSTVATGITPTGGSFVGTFAAPTTASSYIVVAQSTTVPGCSAFATFDVAAT